MKFEGLEFPDDAEFFDGLSTDLAVLGVGGYEFRAFSGSVFPSIHFNEYISNINQAATKYLLFSKLVFKNGGQLIKRSKMSFGSVSAKDIINIC